MSYPYPGGQDSSSYGGGHDSASYGEYGQGYGSASQVSGSSYSPVAQGGGMPACPSPHGGWAAAAVLFFWPLAFVAVGRALEVYPLWAQGRFAEAQAASNTVARLGKISLGIVVGIIVIYFFILFVAILAASA